MRKWKVKHNILVLLITMLVFLGAPTSVLAGVIAESQNGIVNLGDGEASITVSSSSAAQSLKGKTFHVYKLFDAENSADMESVNYTFSESCKSALQNVIAAKLGTEAPNVTEYEVIDYIQSLNTNKAEGAQIKQEEAGYYSDFRYFIEELRDELVKSGDAAAGVITIADVQSDGTVVINGLDYGYYVLDEVTDNAGTYSASSLCIVDTANPSSEVTIKSDYPSVQKQIQEDDNQDVLGNEGWNDMADYEIGQKVPYRFVSHVPDMNGYETYYYAWHDMMDEALSFDPDSVEIVISSEKGEYTLADTEFTVTENVSDETFIVEVDNLKAIVDAHFEKKDALGHNTYGQKIVLTYQAVLNEKAAEGTGVSGFENEVRLEFSNDPDSAGTGKTGFTPWDSVVSFTYRLNGLKVNNHGKVLEGASFRLYRDADCTDEVYVKEGAEGYVVMHTDVTGNTKPEDAVEMVSDAEGVFTVSGLDSGTYYLKETQAPDGYRKLEDPIKLNITASFVADRNHYTKGSATTQQALQELEFSAYTKEFLNGMYTESETELESSMETGAGNLTVVNTVGSKLPFTGSAATLFLLGIGSVLMAASLILGREKRKNAKTEK